MQNNNILKSAKTNPEKIMEWILCPVCNSRNHKNLQRYTDNTRFCCKYFFSAGKLTVTMLF